MNFLSIEYFLVIAEEGSFSRAARRLFVSQQSLSEHIKKLEDELGTPLLKRGNPLTLTLAGECFAEGAKEMLKAKDNMLRNIAYLTDKRRKKITIGIATSEAPPFLPGLLAKFASNYPEYEFVVVKRPAEDISHNMSGIDLYFSFLPLDKNLEHVLLIEDDKFVVVANKLLLGNVYGKRWPSVEQKLIETEDLTLLKDLPFIMLHDKHGNIAQALSIVFESAGFSPVVAFQSDNGDLNASMCVQGIGAYIGPADFCRRKFESYSTITAGDDSLGIYRIKTPGVSAVLALSYEKGKKLHPVEKRFIETARDYIASNDV